MHTHSVLSAMFSLGKISPAFFDKPLGHELLQSNCVAIEELSAFKGAISTLVRAFAYPERHVASVQPPTATQSCAKVRTHPYLWLECAIMRSCEV